MNPKQNTKNKKGKNGLKIEAKNGGPEVYVLPPQVLKKLGINLSTIGVSSEAENVTNAPVTMTDSVTSFEHCIPYCSKNNSSFGTSTLSVCIENGVIKMPSIEQYTKSSAPNETDLSKEFKVSELANSEKYFSNLIENLGHKVQQSSNAVSEVTENYRNRANPRFPTDHDTTNDQITTTKICPSAQSGSVHEDSFNITELNNLGQVKQDINIICDINNTISVLSDNDTIESVMIDILEKTNNIVPADDHPDEAYSSDSNISNYVPIEYKSNVTVPTPQDSCNSIENTETNKIKIVSEKILNMTQFTKISDTNTSTVSNFLPISINAIIRSKKSPENVKTYPHSLFVSNSNNFPQNPVITTKDITTNIYYSEPKVVHVDKEVGVNTFNNKDVNVNFPINITNETTCNLNADETPKQSEELNSDNNFDDCIDISVTDIEKHLEGNEEILENFANAITSCDTNKVLEKIESTDSGEKPLDIDVIVEQKHEKGTNVITELNTVVFSSDKSYSEKYVENRYVTEVDGHLKVENGFNMNNRNDKLSLLQNASDDSKDLKAVSKDNLPFTIFSSDRCYKVQLGNGNNSETITITQCSRDFSHDVDIKTDLLIDIHEIKENVQNVTQNTDENIANISLENNVKYCDNLNNLSDFNESDAILNQTETIDDSLKDLVLSIEQHIKSILNTSTAKRDQFKEISLCIQSEGEKEKIVLPDFESTVLSAIYSIVQLNTRSQTNETVGNGSNEIIRKRLLTDLLGNNSERYLPDYNSSSCQSNCTNPRIDKVQEIALYLKQLARRRSIKRNFASKQDTVIKRIKQHSQNMPKSKTHIHGVEKPRGVVLADDSVRECKTIKTYTKSNTPKQISSHIVIKTDMLENKKVNGDEVSGTSDPSNINISCNVTAATDIRHNNFCICQDFGSLTYYDEIKDYEHIHFLDHKIINCNHDFVFTIYDDEENCTKSDQNILEEVQLTETSGINLGICWNYITDDDNSNNFPNLKLENKILDTCKTSEESDVTVADTMESTNVQGFLLDNNFEKTDGNEVIKSASCAGSSHCDLKLQYQDIKKHSESFHFHSDTEVGQKVNNSRTVNQAEAMENTIESFGVNNLRETHRIDEKLNIAKYDANFDKEHQYKKSSDDRNLNESNVDNEQQDDSCFYNKQHRDIAIDDEQQDCTSFNDEHQHGQILDNKSETTNTDKKSNETNLRKNIDKTDSIKDLQTRKRRRSSTTSNDNLNINKEPQCKKTVKCGFCSMLLSEEEWEDHIDEFHCFIAWRAGESINLQDSLLKKKLKKKLQTSKLNCPLCNFERKTVTKFIAHVTDCLKYKAETLNLSQSDSSTPEQKIKNKSAPLEDSKNETMSIDTSDELPDVICAVCTQNVKATEWINHIASEHYYLAWKSEDPALNLSDTEAIRLHLNNLSKQTGRLKCAKCNFAHKYVKNFLKHLEKCHSINLIPYDGGERLVKCSVCNNSVEQSSWVQHIRVEHDYLAWEKGEAPLDLSSEDSIVNYLDNFSKLHGNLVCRICGYSRRNAKVYWQHVKKCGKGDSDIVSETDKTQVSNADSTLATNVLDTSSLDDTLNLSHLDTMAKCGVCQKTVTSKRWLEHSHIEHNYLAFKEGEPVNLDDEEEVTNLLYGISKQLGGLKCSKCGLVRKYVKVFLQHIRSCTVDFKFEPSAMLNKDTYVCAVCSKSVKAKDWLEHKLDKHYNVAWAVGDHPIDIHNGNVVSKLIKEYSKHRKLVCKTCNDSRTSHAGFYAHILTCGKTDEETEQFKAVCEVCNKKYLKIYHNQHMTAHRAQEVTKLLRQKEIEKREAQIQNAIESNDVTPSKRKAAVKAKEVIENYSSEHGVHKCSVCGLGTDTKEELTNHKCVKVEAFSDSEESVKIDVSDDESSESDVDSDVSGEDETEEKPRRIKNHGPPAGTRLDRIPFKVNKPTKYMLDSGQEHYEAFFSKDRLFPDYYNVDCQLVPEKDLMKYLPRLEVSCKLRTSGNWFTLRRFEASQGKGYSFFTGASIQCMAWVPSIEKHANEFLALCCHRGADVPRLEVDDVVSGPGLIQIWDLKDFKSLPEFVFGIAHDYGTIWAMDWCPSGTRDDVQNDELNKQSRLGLLAVASSNGTAYVFSVPYPSKVVEKNKLFYKLKPVVELRLLTDSERKLYQATSISWSTQKGHSVIVVGYGDGTTAYYDLNTESPLLKAKENDVLVLYPYHDERPHNSCVLGLDTYPCSDANAPMGAVSTACPTGGEMVSRSGLFVARVRSRVPSNRVTFSPLWPSALYSGDDPIANTMVNELEWWGGGRRVRSAASCGACARCGRAAALAPPLLRLLCLHPATGLSKLTIGSIQVIPLAKKRKKIRKDDLTVELEPMTYDDVINKYGIELNLSKDVENIRLAPKNEHLCPERFPLADVTSIAFCKSPTRHNQLALATHAGIVFVLSAHH